MDETRRPDGSPQLTSAQCETLASFINTYVEGADYTSEQIEGAFVTITQSQYAILVALAAAAEAV
jgi:hypothetical protein